jgi:Holliday junction resolvase-like predicted endonuclease
MDSIGLWQIADNGPTRLHASELGAERDLEEWIERDPALLERGLVIVGRQIRLEGGPLDLLALDPQGRWVLIEIKRERLRREVVTQAIDYVSCLHRVEPDWLRVRCDAYLRSKSSTDTLESLFRQRGRSLESAWDDRDVVIYLVGTSIDAGLERMVGFLVGQAELSVRMVTFAVFRNTRGELTLAREIHERSDSSPAITARTPSKPSFWARLIGLLRRWFRQAWASPDVSPRAGANTREPRSQKPAQAPVSSARSAAAGNAGVRESKPAPKAEEVLALADQNGVGVVARTLYAAATDLGLHVRPWGTSIMFAPQANKTRCLITVWTEPRAADPGAAKVWVAAEIFSQFYGISEPELTAALGVGPLGGWLWLDKQKADRLAAGVRQLLAARGDR